MENHRNNHKIWFLYLMRSPEHNTLHQHFLWCNLCIYLQGNSDIDHSNNHIFLIIPYSFSLAHKYRLVEISKLQPVLMSSANCVAITHSLSWVSGVRGGWELLFLGRLDRSIPPANDQITTIQSYAYAGPREGWNGHLSPTGLIRIHPSESRGRFRDNPDDPHLR